MRFSGRQGCRPSTSGGDARRYRCFLVKAHLIDYCHAMLRKTVFVLTLICCTITGVRADTVQLKDKAAISGKVLAEKRDQVVVDVGYTVLVVPRNQVTKILKSDTAAPAAVPAEAVAA